MSCLPCGLDTFREFSEIELDNSSVGKLLPRGIGHGGLPFGVQGSAGKLQRYYASATG